MSGLMLKMSMPVASLIAPTVFEWYDAAIRDGFKHLFGVKI